MKNLHASTVSALAIGIGAALAAAPAAHAGKLTEEAFQCDKDHVLKIEGVNGQEYTLDPNKESTAITISSERVAWYCGPTQQGWTAPAETEWIVVKRGDAGDGVVQYFNGK